MDHDPFYFGQDGYLMMSLSLLRRRRAVSGQRLRGVPAADGSFVESLRWQYTSGSGANVHRRMHVYLRSISDDAAASTEVQAAAPPAGESIEPQVPRTSRLQHIMRERLRRERLSQGYADLHAPCPRYTQYLARNEELDRAAPAGSRCGGDVMVVKVRAESEYHLMLDVFEVVLLRLKATEELRVTATRSCFCAGGMWMDVGVESKISPCEVDNAITNALMELEEIKSGCS